MHRPLLTLALLCVAGVAMAQEAVDTTSQEAPAAAAPAADTAAITPPTDAPAAAPAADAAVTTPTTDAAAAAPAAPAADAAATTPTTDAPATAPDEGASQALTDPAPVGPEPTPAAVATTTPAKSRIAPPPEGMGQVVFFRPKKFAGSAVRFKVREGASELGKLGSGSYFVVPTSPGTHEYTVHSEAKDVLTLEVDAGETYYVEGSINMGFMVGRPNLSPSDEAVFAAASNKLKPAR